MLENPSPIVSKVWSMCGVLYDDGVSYGDYLEQLTYMIFLKMANEFEQPPYRKSLNIPQGYGWTDMNALKGEELEGQYRRTLEKLGEQSGILGEIFKDAQNKISDPSKLARIVRMVDAERWAAMSTDVKGEIYEGLLQKNAEDVKSGAGQFFTPRPLIQAMVECLNPEPLKTIVDPACGSGGFFLAAQRFLTSRGSMTPAQEDFLKNHTFRGWEIVRSTYRLSLMNLFLHNIGDIYGTVPITCSDALLADPGERFDYVLTNPPFGKKSSMTFTNEEGASEREELVYNRKDFWAPGSNKQLNFLQHIYTLLKVGGKAAVVVPDNVLFEAGAGESVRKKLLQDTDLHTILRLPTGIFYKPGVKANVLFFDKCPDDGQMHTKAVWVYDFRTNIHFTLKHNPITNQDLTDFIRCFSPRSRRARVETWSPENPRGRFRRFPVTAILAREKTSLDLFWLKDEALAALDELPPSETLAAEITEGLEEALAKFRDVMAKL